MLLPFVLTTLAMGWLLASRLTRNPLGWLLLSVVWCFLVAGGAAVLGNLTVGWSPRLTAWLGWLAGTDEWGWIWLPAVGILFTQLLLLFPDGHLPSPRWRAFWVFTLAALILGTGALATAQGQLRHGVANPIAVAWPHDHQEWVVPLLGGCLFVSFIGSVASLFVRYRRAGDVARLQLRWVAWAASVVLTVYIASFFVPVLASSLVMVAYALIPAAMGVAVLHYRLYDIDRVVSRTVSYAVATGGVVLTYVAVIALFTRLVPLSSALAVSAATLASAAVLRPLLRRTQAVVDRRFNRQRYDPQVTVDAFGRRLRAEVAVDSIVSELVATVDSTMQPRGVSLWVRSSPG